MAMKRLVVALLLSAAGGAAVAETSAVGPNGFLVTHQRDVQAQPDAVWSALVRLPSWWNSAHTWSGKASNLTLDLRAGGCWCEAWDEASVMHGTVAFVMPGRLLRVYANLGPLHDRPVTGVLAFALARADARTTLRVTYRVAGPSDAGLAELAPAVDRVIGEQVQRLSRFAETGKAD
jgi:uncharacterized protein YndB with AHSA1/START domain